MLASNELGTRLLSWTCYHPIAGIKMEDFPWNSYLKCYSIIVAFSIVNIDVLHVMLLSHWGGNASECAYERNYLTIAQTSQHSPSLHQRWLQIHNVHKSFSTSLRRSVNLCCSHTANLLAMLTVGNMWQLLKLHNIRRVFVSVGNKFGTLTNYSPPPNEDRSI